MSVADLTNLPASVKQRLLNLSRQTQVDFNGLLTRFALERLLYRMSVSGTRPHFILKGALLFGVWSQKLHRTTRDADFLDLRPPSLERLASELRKICEAPVKPDGLRFLSESVQTREIRQQNKLAGIRINLTGMLGKASIPLQIDVGFGDVCVPPAKIINYPVLLDFPAPRLRACSPENMIAEKFLAAVDRGMANSRMKDYFDIFYLSRRFEFMGKNLSRALLSTFERQKIPVPQQVPRGLSAAFAMDPMKRTQWKSFLIRTNAMALEENFAEVVESIRKFLMPAARAAGRSECFDKRWPPGGPWRPLKKRQPR